MKSQDPADQSTTGFFSRLRNTLLIGCSYAFYNKYSKIIYEGDSLSVFGALTYNPNFDRWEIARPIALLG